MSYGDFKGATIEADNIVGKARNMRAVSDEFVVKCREKRELSFDKNCKELNNE